MKDSPALRRIALETISWSSEDVNVHCAASRERPFQGIGTDSKVTAGGGGSGGGATNVPTNVFGPVEDCSGRFRDDEPGDGEGGDEGVCMAASTKRGVMEGWLMEAGGISQAGVCPLSSGVGEDTVGIGEELPLAGLLGPGMTTSTEYFGWVPALGPCGARTGLSRKGGVGLREVCSSWTTLSIVGGGREIRWRSERRLEGLPGRRTNNAISGAHNSCYKFCTTRLVTESVSGFLFRTLHSEKLI